MAASLVEHEAIRTTVPKAKELRRVIEPMITSARTDTVAKRRQAFDRLRDKAAVGKLFTDIAPRFDNAPMAIIEFVERGDSAAGGVPASSDD